MSRMLKWTGFCVAMAMMAAWPANVRAEALSSMQNGHTDKPIWPRVQDARPLVVAKAYPSLETARKIVPGASKDAVYEWIGHPQYREGLFNVHEWDYVLYMPQKKTGDHLTCQLKVLFDDHMRVGQALWYPAACEQLVNGKPPVAEAPKPAEPTVINLSADALFAFNSSVLSPGAPAQIDKNIIDVLQQRRVKSVKSIKVVGTTDRIGSDAYNKALSSRRAAAVMDYMVAHGVPSNAIVARGAGKADPGTTCTDRNRSELIACLAPDRRVQVDIVAH